MSIRLRTAQAPPPLVVPLVFAPSRNYLDSIVVRPALKSCSLLTLGILLWSGRCDAQEPTGGATDLPTSPAQSEAENTSAETGDSGEFTGPASPLLTRPWETKADAPLAAPDVYLLPDEFGKLRKVLGFRYEDFFEAWKRVEVDAGVAPPRYALDALDVSGQVLQAHVRLRIEFEITLQDSNWIDIPIQLPGFIVQQLNIKDQSEGECLVFDKQRLGHVVWLSGQTDKHRHLVMEGLAKLKLNTGSHGIELYLPRATTSRFSLRLPDSVSRFETSPELTLTTVALADNATEVRLLGQASPLRLNWTPEEEDASNQTALIDVEGQTTVHLDRRRASYDTTLKIDSFASPLKQIQVRLPVGANLQAGETSGDYEIKMLGAASGPDQRQVVEIHLREPRNQPWNLRLLAESPLKSFSESAEWFVEGLEVLGASRQTGLVTIAVDDSLQAYFDTHGDIDQVRRKESASTRENSSILGKFRYARFPWQLVVFTSPRQKRVSVTPQYALSISSEEARLDVQYEYRLTGAQIFSFRIDLHGWKLTDAPIESDGLINTAGAVETRDGRLVLPLVDPNTQQLRLKLSLRKDIEFGDNIFFLPEPLGAFVVDGGLSVDYSESLRVTPKLDEMIGLSVIATTAEQPLEATYQNGAAQEDRISLRTFLSQPKFVAEVTQRQRQVMVMARTQVEMDQQRIRVRQRLDYQSKYRPVSQLSLNIPEPLWSNDSLSVTLDGKQLPFGLGATVSEQPRDSVEDESGGSETAQRQMIVSLPRPMQNDIPIEIAYEIATPELASDELTPILLPLATPRDSVRSHQVAVDAAQRISVITSPRTAADQWQVVNEERTEDRSAGRGAEETNAALRLQTDKNLSTLSLYAQLDTAEKQELVTLECAWMQSWITYKRRQERAVFRFRTPHATVFAQLPAGFDTTDIEVLLDGRPWAYEFFTDRRLAIRLSSNGLPTNGQLDSHSLELRYQQATALPSWGELRSALPRLESRTTSAPVYWQLILPRSWQVATSPPQLVADYWLGWKNYRWGRQPTQSQADLEQITGAVSMVGPPPMSSQYVYRAFEIPNEIRVIVIRRTWLVVTCSLAAFGIGLLWVYTPLVRSGVFWLSVSLTLLAGVFSYPEVTLLAIQVILAGGLMTFVTGVLRRVFTNEPASRRAETAYLHESSTALTESWQEEKPGAHREFSETTATLRTSEPLP